LNEILSQCSGHEVNFMGGPGLPNSKDQFFTIIKFPTSPLYTVSRVFLTMYNGEVGNFIMVKN